MDDGQRPGRMRIRRLDAAEEGTTRVWFTVGRRLLTLCDPAGPATSPDAIGGRPMNARSIERLLWLADQHAVLGAVLGNLRDLSTDEDAARRLAADPRGLDDAIRRHAGRMAQRSAIAMLLRDRTGRIMAELRDRDIPAMTIKGAAFAQRLYPKPGMRSFVDVDLLVPPSAWNEVGEAMRVLGYAPQPTRMKYEHGYGEQGWEHPDEPGLVVEVHQNLVNSPTLRQGVSVGFDDVPHDSQAGVVRPTPAGLLLVAAVHGAASHSFDKLQHLVDVAQCARGVAGPIDEPSLRAAARGAGASLALSTALDLAARAFADDACATLVERLALPWPRRRCRALLTPFVVAESQSPNRWTTSWRRKLFRQMLKRRRGVAGQD